MCEEECSCLRLRAKPHALPCSCFVASVGRSAKGLRCVSAVMMVTFEINASRGTSTKASRSPSTVVPVQDCSRSRTCLRFPENDLQLKISETAVQTSSKEECSCWRGVVAQQVVYQPNALGCDKEAVTTPHHENACERYVKTNTGTSDICAGW